MISVELQSDKRYIETNLPGYLKESISLMEKSWAKLDKGDTDLHWDAAWCNLNADINVAEVDHIISPRQANYLREKYLRMESET